MKLPRIFINRWFHTTVLAVALLGVVQYSNTQEPWRKYVQYQTFDYLNKMFPRPAPSNLPVTIVDIDEESLKILGQWPWSRTIMAQMVENLHMLGAKSTTFDIVFSEPDRSSPARIAGLLPADEGFNDVRNTIESLPDSDLVFAEAIANAGNVVTGFTAALASDTLRNPTVKKGLFAPSLELRDYMLTNAKVVEGAATNLPVISRSAAGEGAFIFYPEFDGIIRKIPLVYSGYPKFGQTLYPALSIEALRVGIYGAENGALALDTKDSVNKFNLSPDFYLRIGQIRDQKVTGKYKVPMDSDGTFTVYYRNINPKAEYVPAFKVLDKSYHKEIASRIQNKIIFVGASPVGLRDIRSTPLNLYAPGVEVHANIAEQILQNKFLSRPQALQGIEALSILTLGIFIILSIPLWGVLIPAIICGVALFLGFSATFAAYVGPGLLIDAVYPAICVTIIFIATWVFTYMRTEFERRRVKQAFGLYISPDFMKELTANPGKLQLGGETRELTVMFTDIRNFTSISESLSPEELINLMNDFLTPMSDLVMKRRGTIDKYMGDAMMAFWNAPLNDPDHARHACLAALEMNKALDVINEALAQKAQEKGAPPLRLQAGVGINTGPASVGNMGSRQRFAYSAIGDTVNFASRLESQTKHYGVSILIGPTTKAQIPDLAVVEIDLIRVKGKTEPLHIYSVLGDEGLAKQAEFQNWRYLHEEMIAAYRAQDFVNAERLLAEAFTIAPVALPELYQTYADRINAMKAQPPGAQWDGVYHATTK